MSEHQIGTVCKLGNDSVSGLGDPLVYYQGIPGSNPILMLAPLEFQSRILAVLDLFTRWSMAWLVALAFRFWLTANRMLTYLLTYLLA